MFGSPRVLAVDDNKTHLDGLVNGLQRNGVACLPIHFPSDLPLKPCPDVRIIFADLHLVGQTSEPTRQFAALRQLLEEEIVPRGPYFIVLWTRFPQQATDLETFLDQHLHSATKPFAVIPLDKANHLDGGGNVKNEEDLMAEIVALTRKLPQVGALFDWESNVLHAAGATVSSVLSLASTLTPAHRDAEAGKILAWLGIEAVGREHVENDRFRAVNEALLPILADRIANLRSDDEVWKNSLAVTDGQPLSRKQAGSLNRMVHLDLDARASARGAVIPLPSSLQERFQASFSPDEITAARKQFHTAPTSPPVKSGTVGSWCRRRRPATMRSRAPDQCRAISVSKCPFLPREAVRCRRLCGPARLWSWTATFVSCASAPRFPSRWNRRSSTGESRSTG